MGKKCTIHLSDQGLLSKIYKEFIQLNSKKKTTYSWSLTTWAWTVQIHINAVLFCFSVSKLAFHILAVCTHRFISEPQILYSTFDLWLGIHRHEGDFFHAILCKGLQHLRILLSAGGTWNQFPTDNWGTTVVNLGGVKSYTWNLDCWSTPMLFKGQLQPDFKNGQKS